MRTVPTRASDDAGMNKETLPNQRRGIFVVLREVAVARKPKSDLRVVREEGRKASRCVALVEPCIAATQVRILQHAQLRTEWGRV